MESRPSPLPPDGRPCAEVRDLISAALDGEAKAGTDAVIERHVESCGACAEYRDGAAVLRRRLQLRPHTNDAVEVERLLTKLHAPRLGRGGWTRPVLAWLGLVIAVQSFGPLVLGQADGATTHVARHVGASGLALACGLLYAAWRPHRAYGLLPFVGALCLATVVAAVFDTIDGERSAFAEAVHLAEILGTFVLWLVAGSPGWERFTHAVRSHWPGVLRSTR
jgi:predicted anti-sigma-YlaC factor YlaD